MARWLADTSMSVPAIIENHPAHDAVSAWLSERPSVARLGIAGGAVYDALTAVTADVDGRVLITRDLRAAATYPLVNVTHEFVA